MGSENLFHKHKAKQARNLERKRAKRAAYDRVLIVCEGEKTEPNYFQGLCDYYRLNSANIEICGDCGSAPINVVERAKELYRAEKRSGIPFDRVYCVFDKDSHRTYEAALQAVNNAKPKATFFVVNSIPCFEFWLLLHFTYTTSPFCGTESSNSAGDQVLDRLRKYIPSYAKGNHGCFDLLIDQLPQAMENSKRALHSANENGTDNPTTLVHELVEYLQGLGSTNP
ncbi:MAG: RloB family protein [Xanthomonadales bacterium]|nr:RloB family protein [Xanthomonadales bacterium]